MKTLFTPLFLFTLFSGSYFAQIPVLNSDASITDKVLYLDFDGETVSGTNWDSGNTINALPSTLSNAAMIQVWKRVSEDYWPFEVNVTTEAAKFNAANANSRMRIIVTPTSAWYGSAGGVAYVNSFAWGGNPGTPCWVFENMLSYSAKNVAEAASHEGGHTLSLRHQSTYSITPSGTCTKTAEYNPGLGTGVTSWAPIMGVGYSKNVTIWHNGKSAVNCNTTQFDHGSGNPGITGLAFLDFRVDDAGATYATARTMTIDATNVLDSGLISEPGDIDAIKFNLCYNQYVSISVKPWALDTIGYQGANLDVRLYLCNSAGTQLAVDSSLTKLDAKIAMNLAAGDYYFKVDGGGSPNYSDYGSLGRYYISISAPNAPLYKNVITTSGPVCSGEVVPLTYTTNGFVTNWVWTVSGPTSGTYTTQNPTVSLNPGTHTLSFLGDNSSVTTCVTTATLLVKPTPQVSVQATAASPVCYGNSNTLTASGATSYTWQPGGSNNAAQVITPGATAVYSVTGMTNGCSNSQTITIAVVPGVTVVPAASDLSVCPGATAAITISGAASVVVNPGNIVSNPAIVSPTATTIYTITGIGAAGGCTDDSTLTISMKECDGVGIAEHHGNIPGVRVYPNPAEGWVIVESATNDQQIRITNATGQLIWSLGMNGAPLRVATESWAAGIYFIELLSPEGFVHTEKIVVRKK